MDTITTQNKRLISFINALIEPNNDNFITAKRKEDYALMEPNDDDHNDAAKRKKTSVNTQKTQTEPAVSANAIDYTKPTIRHRCRRVFRNLHFCSTNDKNEINEGFTCCGYYIAQCYRWTHTDCSLCGGPNVRFNRKCGMCDVCSHTICNSCLMAMDNVITAKYPNVQKEMRRWNGEMFFYTDTTHDFYVEYLAQCCDPSIQKLFANV